MDEIKNIVQQVIGKMAREKQSDSEKIQLIWNEILKNEGVEHTKISGWKERKLIVSVESPAWLYQFQLKKQKILLQLQKAFPDIENIYFKIGAVS